MAQKIPCFALFENVAAGSSDQFEVVAAIDYLAVYLAGVESKFDLTKAGVVAEFEVVGVVVVVVLVAAVVAAAMIFPVVDVVVVVVIVVDHFAAEIVGSP